MRAGEGSNPYTTNASYALAVIGSCAIVALPQAIAAVANRKHR